MKNWSSIFRYSALSPLLESGDKNIIFFVRRDLLEEILSLQDLWKLPAAIKIFKKQNEDGSWRYPGATKKGQKRYDQMETFRCLGTLIEEFGLKRNHPAISKAAEYFFSFQTEEGDFRGIYGNQYSPNYSAGITELLVKAGYQKDLRIEKVYKWLISIRQNDGGWAIPFRTKSYGIEVIANRKETIEPDKSKPYSHMVTGVVLRAFAAHAKYRNSKEAQLGGKLLALSLFKKDSYPDRSTPTYWQRFTFPFLYTDLISALDSLSHIGFSKDEPQIKKALQWFIDTQQKTGIWKFKITKGQNKELIQLWLALAVCRIFKRFGQTIQ